ncbi:MAG: SWIM zinc finger family protein [Phycisphaerales bacterium]|nr:SWIM zinc finger family protein [Phycisphaerales bacterium]
MLALSPDAGSASAGSALASASKWTLMQRSERAVWGLCQGSGKEPYQVRIDLGEPAFKCSCPSRKFPCKHGIGLLLLLAKNEKGFASADEPGWVSEWIEGRQERAVKKVEKAAAPPKPVDAEAQAARQAKRETRVRDGAAQCRVWLTDLARRGLASVQSEGSAFWEEPAARMVDAQAPGLAAAIRRIGQAMSSGDGWPARTTDMMGRLSLLLSAAERIDTLPQDLAQDVRVALGWTQSKDEAMEQPGVADRWMVLGQVVEDEDRLRVRRTWLAGRQTKRHALVLEFAVGQQPMDATLQPGTEFDGEVAFYPSCVPLRGLVKSRQGVAEALRAVDRDVGDDACECALRRYAEALAKLPWITRWPMVLIGVKPGLESERFGVVDKYGRSLPVKSREGDLWRWVSASGGRAVDLFGEWDGEHFLPVAMLPGVCESFEDLAPRWSA